MKKKGAAIAAITVASVLGGAAVANACHTDVTSNCYDGTSNNLVIDYYGMRAAPLGEVRYSIDSLETSVVSPNYTDNYSLGFILLPGEHTVGTSIQADLNGDGIFQTEETRATSEKVVVAACPPVETVPSSDAATTTSTEASTTSSTDAATTTSTEASTTSSTDAATTTNLPAGGIIVVPSSAEVSTTLYNSLPGFPDESTTTLVTETTSYTGSTIPVTGGEVQPITRGASVLVLLGGVMAIAGRIARRNRRAA